MKWKPTEHQEYLGKELEGTPEGTVVLRVEWPEDGRPQMNPPITRVQSVRSGQASLGWTDGRSTAPSLDESVRYLLLHLPAPEPLAIGAKIERWHLDWFPARTVVADRDGWVAQLCYDEDDQGEWHGPIQPGGSMTHDDLWEESNKDLALVSIPSGSALSPRPEPEE